MKTTNKLISITIILLFVFLTIRCEMIDDITPNYAGDWVFENGTSKIELSLYGNSFKRTEYKDIEYGPWCITIGDLIVNDLRMFFITNTMLIDTSMIKSEINLILFTEYNRGTSEFTDRFGLGLDSYDFGVADDKLIFYSSSESIPVPMIFKRKDSNL